MGLFANLFEEKKLIYRKRDKETYLKIKSILKENNINGIKYGHYLQEDIIAGGCASQLDPRDLGPNGKIDRDIYYIKVPASKYNTICNLIFQNGIKTEVVSNKDLRQKAPDKARAKLLQMKDSF